MNMATASSAVAPPKLRPARLEDYQDIVRLGVSHSLDIPTYQDWSSLWLENPLRRRQGKDFPIGWVLVLPDGETVGTMGTVRAPYTWRGEELVSAVSRAWFVTAAYRGFALELMDEYLNQPGVDLFINNAVSMPAFEMFSQFCERIPLGEWDCASYWIVGNPSDEELCADDAVNATPLSKIATSCIDSTDRFDSRFDRFWDDLVRENPEKLLAERTSEALTWHFAAPLRKKRLWILTAARRGRLVAYCTLTRQDHAFRLPALPHGDCRRLPGMRLVDYQTLDPEIDFLPAFLQTALERCATENLYILENLGRGVPKMHAVDEGAPYRKDLGNWKFFYRAADSALHADLSTPRPWDPSAYDGDNSFE
jgi:hypothetical protein